MFRAARVVTFLAVTSLSIGPAAAKSIELEPEALRAKIERISVESGPFAPELGPYLRALGNHYLALGRGALAKEMHGRWQHILQREDGVHTVRQLDAINGLIRAWSLEGAGESVDQLIRFKYHVAAPNFEPGSHELFAPLLEIGKWNAIVGRLSDSKRELRDALAIAEHHNRPHDRLGALRASAMSQYLNGRCCYEKTLSKALKLVSHNERFDLIDRGVATRDLADAYIMKRKPKRAKALYRTAAGLLPDTEEGVLLGVENLHAVVDAFTRTGNNTPSLRSRHLLMKAPETEPQRGPLVVGAPITMCSSAVREFAGGKSAENLALDVSLTVTPRGRVRDVTLCGAAPTKLKRYVRQTLLQSKYRPAVDQERRVEFTQSFSGIAAAAPGLPDWNRLVTARGCQMVAML